MRRPSLRAISPVVATVLLVLIAVAVSVLLYTWVSGIASYNPSPNNELVQTRIVIDEVGYHAGKLSIYVRNLGPTPVNLSAVYVINSSNNNIIFVNTSLSKITIPPGSVREINISGLGIRPGTVIVVKVVAKNGAMATYIAPVRST